MKTSINRLRKIGLIEGVSFLVLLLIAMPLKYFANMPEAVKVVGWAHGLLFMLYVAALAHVWLLHRWGFLKLLIAFAASLIPFGPFLLDSRLKKEANINPPPVL